MVENVLDRGQKLAFFGRLTQQVGGKANKEVQKAPGRKKGKLNAMKRLPSWNLQT